MNTRLDQSLVDRLLPFGFITDQEGIIIGLGRSLSKLCPDVAMGSNVHDHFVVAQPTGLPPRQPIPTLVGDLVVLSSLDKTGAKLRGQIVAVQDEQPRYIFAFEPLLTTLSDISRYGLTMNDFAIGDPVFDFFLYMQGNLTNQQKLKDAKRNLEWENRSSKTLLSIALASEQCSTEQEIYQKTLHLVCSLLDWGFGHVYILDEGASGRLITSSTFELREPETFLELRELTLRTTFQIGEGFPGIALQARDIIWLDNPQSNPNFLRRNALRSLSAASCVQVPIIVNDKVISVLEFVAQRNITTPEKFRRFFSLLSMQLGIAIARQRAELAAREHLQSLLNASKMATLGEIAAGVGHEINNPLHTLSLTAHLLRRLASSGQLSNEMLNSQLEKVDSSIQQMAKIVGELKAFSRDSSGDEFVRTPLKKLIGETLHLGTPHLRKPDVALSITDIPDTWSVECRPSQISQVILNLVGNAYDALGDQPGQWIRIDARDTGTSFEISVTDSGSGISEATARKIMSPFFTTKPPGKGTGLGLSISKNIVSSHGGRLELDRSSPHTRFVVTLPKQHDAAALSVESIPETKPEAAPLPSQGEKPSTSGLLA